MLDAHACAQLERGLKTLAVRMGTAQPKRLRACGLPANSSRRGTGQLPRPVRASRPCHSRTPNARIWGHAVLSAARPRPNRTIAGTVKNRHARPESWRRGEPLLRPRPNLAPNDDPEARRQAGISDGLVRLSVGIEDIADLMADFQQALNEENPTT